MTDYHKCHIDVEQYLMRRRNIVLERTATGGWRTLGNNVEKAKLSARSPFDPLLCTCVRPGHLDKDRGNYLIKPKIDPGDNKPSAKHSAVGALNGANGPEEESEPEHRERNVPVGDLAQRSPEKDPQSLVKGSYSGGLTWRARDLASLASLRYSHQQGSRRGRGCAPVKLQ